MTVIQTLCGGIGAGVRAAARRFTRDRRGNVAIVFGIMFIPLMVIAAGAVDITRATSVRLRLSEALDATGLAIARSSTLSDTAMRAYAKKFFDAQMPPRTGYDIGELQITKTGSQYVLSNSVRMQTLIMRIIGRDTISVSASSQVIRGLVGLEVGLVIDNTGSMGTYAGGGKTRIEATRDSAKLLVDTLKQAVEESSLAQSSLKIGLIPFTLSVNIGGSAAFDGSWIDGWNHAVPQAKYAGAHFVHVDALGNIDPDRKVNALEIFDSANQAWGGCVEARPSPMDVDDTPPDASADAKWVPFLFPDEPDNDCPSSETCNSSTEIDHYSGAYSGGNYQGEDSIRDYNYVRTWGVGSALYQDFLDKVFTSGGSVRSGLPSGLTAKLDDMYITSDSREYRLRMFYPGRYDPVNQKYIGKYNFPNDTGDMNQNCPSQPVLALTDALTKSQEIKDRIDDMTAGGSTNVAVGLAWGWRVLSPGEPFSQGAAYNDPEVRKALVVLTDGRNDLPGDSLSYLGAPYNTYGYGYEQRLGSGNNTDNEMEDVIDSRVSTLCENIKAKNIRVYTITFAVTDTATVNRMRDCATEPGLYFNSPDSADLQNAFRQIAEDLASLYISK